MNELQYNEAVGRLNSLIKKGADKELVSDFENGIICLVNSSFMGLDTKNVNEIPMLYREKMRLEKDYGVLVYYATMTCFSDIMACTFLFVSGEQDNWESEREELDELHPYCYTKNLDYDVSDFGIGEIENLDGAVFMVRL